MINNSNKYDVYNIEPNKEYYKLGRAYDNNSSDNAVVLNPNNGIDGTTFRYHPIDHVLNAPKCTWIATISIVEEGGDKHKPLQIYDIYRGISFRQYQIDNYLIYYVKNLS